MMKAPSILIVAACAVPLIPIATASRRNTSAWNAPSRGRFGIRRTNSNNISKAGSTSFIVEPLSSSPSSLCADGLDDMDMALQLQDESLIEESMRNNDPRWIITEGVRAAAVACVSAAAIGGARHALELLF